MDIGLAIKYTKLGHKVTRVEWNGTGKYVVLMPELYLPPYNSIDTIRKVNDRTAKYIGEGTPLDSQPYFAVFTAQEQWQPGWIPSQADLLADDWELMK